MSTEMIFVLSLVIAMLGGLLIEVASPHIIVFSILTILLITGILTPKEALSGFSNEGMLTIALMFIVAGAVQKSGIIEKMMNFWLDKSKSLVGSMVRIFVPISIFSGFINNTPIVVTFTPMIKKWCEERGFAPSKFLIPLSYATILGGTITLMGSSTNLVVHGMLINSGYNGFSLFQLSIVGIPITIIGLAYIFTIGYKILPINVYQHQDREEDSKKYISKQVYSQPRFDAGLKAVHRSNGQIEYEMVEIVLKPEALRLLTGTHFIEKYQQSNDSKVSTSLDSSPSLHPLKGWFSIIILLAMIILVTFGVFSMLKAMALAVILLLVTKVMTAEEAKNYIHFDVLLLIASSFGVGVAMTKTGLAGWTADALLAIGGPLGLFMNLIIIYVLTNIFTELITNSAAAIIMLPIGIKMADSLQLNPMGFAVLIVIAASASFITPIGYQTNLIVQGPGGYKFTDYIKIGTPLSFIVMLVTVTIVYFWWF